MSHEPKSVQTVLIVPCYNEASRLNLSQFHDAEGIGFVFVDDGSVDPTSTLIAQNLPPHSLLHKLEKNQGKAEAVRQGMRVALTHPQFREAQWLGFWDADLATPLAEVHRMLRYREFYIEATTRASDPQVIFGSRVQREGSTIVRNPKRHYLGRGFATLASLLLGIKTYDSQCGAKLFSRAAAEVAFQKPFLSRWIFDLEIILRVKPQFVMIEYPLITWTDIAGSKVQPLKEFPRVLKDLWAIRRSYRPLEASSRDQQGLKP